MGRKIEIRGRLKGSGEWTTYVLMGGFSKYDPEFNSFMKNMDAKTLGQWTGLRDSNGVKIFESDIVQNDDGCIGVIYWDKDDCSFMVKAYTYANIIEGHLWDIYANNAKNHTVIGNIYDNPELLKRENIKKTEEYGL